MHRFSSVVAVGVVGGVTLLGLANYRGTAVNAADVLAGSLSDVSLGDPLLDRALDRVYAQLQPLFQKYYPGAIATNLHRNGIHFEHQATTFEFPYTGNPRAKHESPSQRGPKQGGILCSVSLAKGPYAGPVAMPARGSVLGPMVVDKKAFKVMLMAPYAARRDVHLWARLSYPADASKEFLKSYVALMTAFEQDSPADDAPTGAGKRAAPPNGTDQYAGQPKKGIDLDALAERLAKATGLGFQVSASPAGFTTRRDVRACEQRQNRLVAYFVVPAVPGDRVGLVPPDWPGAAAVRVIATEGRYTFAASGLDGLETAEKIAAVLGQTLSREGKIWLTPPTPRKLIGPAQTAAVESVLIDQSIGVDGIWPREENLAGATSAELRPLVAAGLEEWFSRVLKESLQPEHGDWNSAQWLIVPKLRWDTNYLLGHCASRDPRVARIEFQASVANKFRYVSLTIVSDELFPDRQYGSEEIRDMLGGLLNTPEDCLPNLVVDAHFVTAGDGKTALTYGKVFDARVATRKMESAVKKAAKASDVSGGAAPPSVPPETGRAVESEKPLIPDDQREWYSPMRFWIANGRLAVGIWTVDWKSGDRPM